MNVDATSGIPLRGFRSPHEDISSPAVRHYRRSAAVRPALPGRQRFDRGPRAPCRDGPMIGNARRVVLSAPLAAYSDEAVAFRLAHVPVGPLRSGYFLQDRCPVNPAHARRRSDARAGYRSHQRRALRSAVGNGEARRLRGLPRATADSIFQNGHAVASGSRRGCSRPRRNHGQRHGLGKREATPKNQDTRTPCVREPSRAVRETRGGPPDTYGGKRPAMTATASWRMERMARRLA